MWCIWACNNSRRGITTAAGTCMLIELNTDIFTGTKQNRNLKALTIIAYDVGVFVPLAGPNSVVNINTIKVLGQEGRKSPRPKGHCRG